MGVRGARAVRVQLPHLLAPQADHGHAVPAGGQGAGAQGGTAALLRAHHPRGGAREAGLRAEGGGDGAHRLQGLQARHLPREDEHRLPRLLRYSGQVRLRS